FSVHAIVFELSAASPRQDGRYPHAIRIDPDIRILDCSPVSQVAHLLKVLDRSVASQIQCCGDLVVCCLGGERASCCCHCSAEVVFEGPEQTRRTEIRRFDTGGEVGPDIVDEIGDWAIFGGTNSAEDHYGVVRCDVE